jgi:hypothetical protein
MADEPQDSKGAEGMRRGERAVAPPLQPRLILELLGATAGIAAFVAFVGGALMWLRFDALGLPADRAVSLLPRELLLTVGVHALIVPAMVGLGAVIALYALEDWTARVLAGLAFVAAFVATLVVADLLFDLSIGLDLLAAALAAVVVGGVAAVTAHELCEPIRRKEKRPMYLTLGVVGVGGVVLLALVLGLPVVPHMAIVGLTTAAGAGAILATAAKAEGRRPVSWVVFVSFLLVGAAVALARTADEPKLEPVALLLEEPREEITGFYVGEADGRVYVAQLRHVSGLAEVSAEPVEAIVRVSRDRVTRMALRSPAGLGLADEGREQAERLLEDMIVERRLASGERPPPAEPVDTNDPVSAFAPLVSIHSGEPVAPTSADYFLDGSRLLWSFRGCKAKALTGRLTDSEARQRLGQGGFRQAARCGDRGTSYRSSDYTRPYGKRREGLVGKEGFYLNLDNGRRKPKVESSPQGSQQVLAGVPVYYERHAERETRATDERITYWFFYPFSIPPGGNDKVSHEGDWERLSVLVVREPTGWRPLSVRYHEHDTHLDVPWADVRKAPDEAGIATHPRAYVAKGSHATYRRAGRSCRC